MPLPLLALAVVLSAAGSSPAVSPAPSASPLSSPARELLDRYCVTCHNQRLKTAGLSLDAVDPARVADRPDVWEKVARKLGAGLMPPVGRPRPDAATNAAFVAWIEGGLDHAASEAPNPGRTDAFHRLNRTEYRNAIRDLLALDVDVSELPADDTSYGFDTIAGVLKIDQSRMEQYLSSAARISRAALGASVGTPLVQEFRVAETLRQYEHVEGLPFGTRGGTLIRYQVPEDGTYVIKVDLLCHEAGCDGSAGFVDRHEFEVSVDGAPVGRFVVEPHTTVKEVSGRDAVIVEGAATAALSRPDWHVRLPLKAGPRQVGVAFVKLPEAEEVESLRQRFLKPYYQVAAASTPASQAIFQPFVEKVTISGPFQPTGIAGETPSRRRILVCHPSGSITESHCARTILSTLARRAYRGPISASDMQPLLDFYREGSSDGGFEAGVELAVRRLLVSPRFLFRIERDPPGARPGQTYRIDDLALASRLSFFIWSSIPDDELLRLASTGQLSKPPFLERQVRRMLADSRSSALVENFAAQWLGLRSLDVKTPYEPMFPNFDEGLREAFRRETALFVESVIREDRDVVSLLDADYTFANERLARHYGLPLVKGSHFRRVPLAADSPRRGLLGQGSVLLVTSHAVRTSPVLRGKWILENILGTPPPDPPANVPALTEKAEGTTGHVLSVRARMAQHRANVVCAGCHAVIDPLGFALENFDAVGRWREVDDGFNPIDPSGALPDGTAFEGFRAFKAVLLAHPERFVMTLTEKLLVYALGRGLEPYDMPAVRAITRAAGTQGNRVSAIVLGIVNSVPFQMRRSAPVEPAE